MSASLRQTSVKSMHCLSGFHGADTPVGKDLFDKYGLAGLEATDQAFEVASVDRVR
jgi:ornithine carbamoyltransferase